jgi:hypothetical protein
MVDESVDKLFGSGLVKRVAVFEESVAPSHHLLPGRVHVRRGTLINGAPSSDRRMVADGLHAYGISGKGFRAFGKGLKPSKNYLVT